MKPITKQILKKTLSLFGSNALVRQRLRYSAPKSAHPSKYDLPDIISHDYGTWSGKCRRILPIPNDLAFSPEEGYRFQLAGSNASALTRLVYWYGIPQMDFYPNSPIWNIVNQAKTIVDIGANIGLYLFCFKQAAPNAKLFAFEPAPEVFQTLERNVALNQTRAEIYPYAITDYCGDITLYIPPTECDASTRASLPDEAKILDIPVVARTVPAFTLDELSSRLNMGPVDFVKLDTEGTEPAVLRGMAHILATDKPDIFCEVVVGTHTERDLEALLLPHGYHFYQLIRGELLKVDSIVPDPDKQNLNFFFSTRLH